NALALSPLDTTFAIGISNLEARYRAEELIELPAPALIAIGERELKAREAEFAATAARVDAHRDALQVWRDVQEDHPKPGELVGAARGVMDELFSFIQARALVRLT